MGIIASFIKSFVDSNIEVMCLMRIIDLQVSEHRKLRS